MVRITVVKKALFNDIAMRLSDETIDYCDMFYEGQVFEVDDIDIIPSNFCSWAWADIQRDVAMINFGAQPKPKLAKARSIVSCCTEGLRPVVFNIEYYEGGNVE